MVSQWSEINFNLLINLQSLNVMFKKSYMFKCHYMKYHASIRIVDWNIVWILTIVNSYSRTLQNGINITNDKITKFFLHMYS